jgi:RNA polymerase sigma-70 factor (ECF subfamily)
MGNRADDSGFNMSGLDGDPVPAGPDGILLPTSESTARRYELSDPDVRLMLEVREGNASAFEELMLRYQNRVLTIIEHLVGSRDEAEDLTQDVFLRVFRSRKRYVPGAKFSTWLFTIVNNVALNARRGRSRRREVQVAERLSESGNVRGLAEMAQAASGQLPTRILDKAEMRDVVRAALSVLNERQLMAVLLNKFEGLGYAEIAEAMEMSSQAVKSLLSRARQALREVLEPYLDQGARPGGDEPLVALTLNRDGQKSSSD